MAVSILYTHYTHTHTHTINGDAIRYKVNIDQQMVIIYYNIIMLLDYSDILL